MPEFWERPEFKKLVKDLKDKDPERQQRKEELRNPTEDAYSFFGASPPSSEQGMPHPGLYPPPTEGRPYTPSGQEAASAVSRMGEQGLPDWLRPSGGSGPEEQEGLPPWIRAPDSEDEGPQGMPHPGLYKPKVKPFDFGLGEIAEVAQSYRQEVQEALADTRSGRVGPTTGLARLGKAWWDSARSLWTRQQEDDEEQTWITKEDPETGATFVQPVDIQEPAPMMRFISSAWMFPKGLVGRTIGGDDPESKVQEQRLRMFAQGIHVPLKLFEAGWNSGHGWLWGLLLGKKPNGLTEIREDLIRDAVRIKQQPVQQRLFGLPFLEAAKDAGGSLLGLWFQNMRGEFGEWNEDVLRPALEEYQQINREYQELTKDMEPTEELALRMGFRRSQITEDEFRDIVERNTTEILGQEAMTPGGAFGALAELARKDPALDVPPQVARGAAEMVQATSNMLWVPGQPRPPITFPNPLTQSEAYADAMFEAQQNGWVTPEYNLELFMRGARRVGEYISAVDPDFSYTWLLDDDAHESYQEAKEQVEAQTGQSLTFWQARRLKEHYENPVTEMIGEAIFDLTWMVPDSVWEATFKTLSMPLRLTGNVGFRALKRIPLVGDGIKWLTKETTLSQGRVLGFKASEIFGSIYQASSDSRAFVNTVQEVAELNTVPSTIGSRQLRLMREVGKYIGPDEWATVADDAVQHALEVEKKRLARAGASADEIARAQPDPVEVVSHIADTFEARFIDEAQQAMDDRLVSEASEALGNAANWLRKAWIEQILSVRPGFAAINYMDSAFRVLVMGANPWADIEHIEATTLIPRSLRERFLATEADAALPIGQMPTGGPFGYMWHETGTSVFDDLPWPLGKRPWTRSKEAAEGFAANHPKANWLLRRFNMANWAAGWKEFNTAFEYALSARLYHELYWTKFFELDTRIGREVWERVLSDETTRNLARRIWNEAGDNPAQIETLVTEALEGKQVQGRPMWTLLVPPEVHDWLRGMPHDQQQILIKKTILDLRSGLADAADDAARRSSINKVFEDLRQAFAEEYDVHRQARAADDAMRGKDMVDPHAAARASTGDTPDDLGEEVESRLRAISGEAEAPPDRPGGALGQFWDAYDNQLDAPLAQDPAGLQRTPKNGVRMIREAAEKDLGVDELWVNLDADMKESLRQIGSDHGMGPKEALAEILANPNEELTIVERAGIENLADELEEVRPPRMSQEDLNTLNQGGPEAERLRTERELVEAEARVEAQNLTAQATDDELMESMGLSNKERIWMGENPSPTFDNGAQDYAAQEWLRRHPEPSGAPGVSTSAETIAARVDELMEEGVSRKEATRRAVDEAIDASSVEGGRPIEPLSDRPSVDTSTPEGRREVLDRLEEELAEVKGPRSEAREAMEEAGQQAREEFGKLHDELSETAATQEVSQDYWVVWDDIEQMRSRMHDFLYKVWPGPGRMRNTPSQVWDAYYSLRRQLYEADVQIARQLRRSLDTGEARFLRRMSPVDYLERAGFRLNFDESGRLLSLEDVNNIRRKTPLETTDAMEKLEAIMLRDAPEGHSLQDPFHGRQPPPAAGGAGPAPSDGGAPRTGPRPGPEPPTPATPPDEVNDRGFSVQEIRTEDVKLSPDFQPRDTSGEPMQVDNRRIRELAQQWDWKHYEPIKVNVVQDDAAEYAADVAPGDVVMMGGHHRLGAAREAGIDQLPAQVYRLTHDEAQYVANIDNMVRQDQTPWEKGQIFSSRVALGDTETDLARIVYNDPNKAGLVAKYASLNELAPSVGRQVGQSTWFSEKHGFSLADAVIKYDISPEAQQQIVNRYLAEIQPSVTMLRQFLETYGPKAQQAKQLGLFEISETWLDEFAEVQERLRTMRGSAQSAQRIVNNPELADQLGVDIEDAKKVVDELQEQEAELRRISGLDPTQPVSTQDVGEVVDDAVQGAGGAADEAADVFTSEEAIERGLPGQVAVDWAENARAQRNLSEARETGNAAAIQDANSQARAAGHQLSATLDEYGMTRDQARAILAGSEEAPQFGVPNLKTGDRVVTPDGDVGEVVAIQEADHPADRGVQVDIDGAGKRWENPDLLQRERQVADLPPARTASAAGEEFAVGDVVEIADGQQGKIVATKPGDRLEVLIDGESLAMIEDASGLSKVSSRPAGIAAGDWVALTDKTTGQVLEIGDDALTIKPRGEDEIVAPVNSVERWVREGYDASGGRRVVGAGPPGPAEVGSRVSHIQKGEGTVVEVLDPAPNGADRVRVELDSGETTVMQGTSFTIVREEAADEAAESAQRIARATGEASEEAGTRAREYVEPEEVPEPRDGGPSVAETEGVGEARPEPRAPREAERPVPSEPSTTTAGGGLAQGKRTRTGVTTIAEESLPQPGEYVSAEYLQNVRERSRAYWIAQGVDEAEAEARAIQFMEHQVDNANRAFTAFDRGHGFVIADSTGTGKTYSAALIADQVFERGGDRVLVVAPSRDILGQWGEVLEQMGIKMEQFATKEGIPGSIPAAERGIVYGTTYATMNRWAGKNAPYGQDMLQMLGGKPADLIIFDESHYLKNWYQDTKRANVGVELAQQSDHALFMSATALESPLHYGYLADALGDGGIGSFDEMLESLNIQRVEREVEYTTRGGGRATRTYETYEGVSPEKLAELNTRLVENGAYIRHEMSYSGIYDRETGELLHAYTASVPVPIDEELADMYERFHRIADKHSGGRFGSQIEAQRTAIGRALLENAKVPEAAQLAQKKVDEGKSVALFVWRKEGDNWERHLQEFLAGERKYARGSPIPDFYQDLIDAGVEIKSPIRTLQETFPDAVVVSGDVTGQARKEAIERFNQGRTNVMIVTIDAGGVGLSLHDKIGDFPRVQINLTTPYTALAMDQVAGRTFRMGSQSNAEIYWLYVDTPLEKKYVNRTIRRSQQMGALIGGHETLASDKDLIEFTFTVDDVTAKSPYSDLPVTLQETGPVDIDRYTTPPWEQADWEPEFRPGFGPEEPTVHMPPEQPVVKDWPEQQDGRIFLGESPVTGDAYYQDPNSREIYRANEPGQGMRWESTYGGWDDSGRELAFPDHANQVRERETLSDIATDREEILADLRDLERRKQSLLNEAQELKEAGGKSADVGNLNTEASAISDRQAELLTAIGEDVDDATLERLVYPLGDAADDLQQVRIPGGPWGSPETISIEEAQDRLFDLEMYLRDPDAAAAGGAAELTEARAEASALEDAIRKAQGEAAPSAGETPVQTMRNMAAQRDALIQRMDNLPEQTIMEIEDKGFVPEELAGRWELTDVDGDLFWRKVDTDRFEPHGRFRNYLIDEAGVERAIAGDHSYIKISEYGPGVVSTDAGPQFSMLRDDVKPQEVTLETDEMQQAWRLEARKRGWLDKWGEEAEDYDTFIRALQKDRERIANTMGEAAAADADAMIEEAKSVAQTIQQSFGTQDAFFIANIPWWMKVPGERALQEASEDALAQYHAAMRGLDNWESWLLDEQNLIAPALTDEQAEQLSRWGQEAIEAKRQVRDTARHGGQLLGSTHRGAEPETLRVMINYAMESNLDSILKHPFPFIKFPTRSIPAWIEIIGTHPEILAWWMRYRTMSERYAFQHGAVDSQGRQLNRLRGYVPVPGTDLWWNPTAPLSARVVLPNDRTIYGIQEQGEQTPIQRAVNFLYGRGRIFGFNPAPWYEIPLLRVTGLIDTDRYPTRAVVPGIELVPPWWQRSILTGLRKTVYPNAPDLWEPEVSWKDYLIEQRMLEQGYQAVLEAPPEEQYAVAERYEQALLDREESQLWRDARREVEEGEYYRRLFGFYTGVYPKQFSDAEAELLRMRNNINFLRDSIDDEINASLFGLSPDAEVRREGWMDERYNTPQGLVYNAVSTTRWTVVPGEGQLHGAERRKYISDQIRTDIATRSLFEEIGNINDEMQQALAALPRGAPWELKQPIFEEFGQRRSNARNRHPDARKSAGLSGFTTRTEEQLQEYWVGLWYDILLETKPQYKPDQESFPEYEQRVLEWESELPQIAEATLPAFMREATTIPRPETLPDFTTIADPEIMEAYDMRDDTPVEALDRVWEENYWSEYWDEIEGLEGYERDLAEMRFKMRWPNGPSDQQLLTWVQDRYGDQFTKKQLQDVLRSGAMNIEDRMAVGRSELEQQGEQVWTLINWVGPSKTKLREAYLAAGGSREWWDYWWKSDGTPDAFPESDWSRFYEHMMIAGNSLELKKPSQETMEEWAYVDQINRDFKERARVRFGEDIFSVSAAYAQTPFSQRAEFRQTHPELTAFWDFRDQWTADHPLWAQYYRPDALKKPSTGGSGRFSGSRSGGAGAPAAPTEPETTYRIAPTSYRSSQYARDLLGEGLGTGGYGGIIEWPGTPPPRFEEEVPIEVLEDIQSSQESGQDMPENTKTYLNTIYQNHPAWRHYIKKLLSGAPLGSRAPRKPNAREDLLERDLKRRID